MTEEIDLGIDEIISMMHAIRAARRNKQWLTIMPDGSRASTFLPTRCIKIDDPLAPTLLENHGGFTIEEIKELLG